MKTKCKTSTIQKKAALDIARAVTAKLWYIVIKDIQRINNSNVHYVKLCWQKIMNSESMYAP